MSSNSTPNERLQELIKLLRVKSVNAFAESIGISQSVVRNMVGARQSKPSFESLEKIKARYPRVNLEWLITGEGEPLRPSGANPAAGIVAREESQVQYGNTGNTVGTMAGGSLSYSGTADCLQALEACRGRVRELEGMVADKQRIIELMEKLK